MEAVERSIGFVEMDSMILRTIEGWFKSQLQSIASSTTTASSESDALYSLALQHSRSGEYIQGESAARKAVAIRTRIFGELNIETLAAKGVLGMLLRSCCKYEEARCVCVEVVEGRSRVLGPGHSETMTARANLGAVLYEMRRYDEALPILLETTEFCKTAYGISHGNTLSVMNTTALVYEQLKMFDQADAVYSTIEKESQSNLGPSHPASLLVLHNYADFLFNVNRVSEARAKFTECFEGRRRVLGPQHPLTLATKSSLEQCHSMPGGGQKSFFEMRDWDSWFEKQRPYFEKLQHAHKQ